MQRWQPLPLVTWLAERHVADPLPVLARHVLVSLEDEASVTLVQGSVSMLDAVETDVTVTYDHRTPRAVLCG